MSRKKKKSLWSSTFYRVYFVAVAVALVAIAIGTVWLRGVLKDYESAQPVYVAREAARLFEASDFDRIYALDTSARDFGEEDKALYVDTLTELARGKSVAWDEAFSPNEDERNYSVTLDGERFATFTLVPSGETTARGNRLWKLGSVTTGVSLQQAEAEEPPEEALPEVEEPAGQTYLCRITAPKGYTVTVDGVALSPENAQTSEKQLFAEGFLPEGVENPAMTEYLYDSLTWKPEIHAADDTGAEVTVTAVEDRELTWTCAMKEDDGYRQQYSKAAISLAKRVAKFISGDAGKKGIQKICAKKSPAEDIFDNLYNRYTTPHDGISFQNEQVSEVYVLSENCFTCRVTFDVVLDTKKGKSVDPTDYTFCVVRQGGSGKLYNILIS